MNIVKKYIVKHFDRTLDLSPENARKAVISEFSGKYWRGNQSKIVNGLNSDEFAKIFNEALYEAYISPCPEIADFTPEQNDILLESYLKTTRKHDPDFKKRLVDKITKITYSKYPQREEAAFFKLWGNKEHLLKLIDIFLCDQAVEDSGKEIFTSFLK